MTAAMARMVVTMAALVDSSDSGVPAVSGTTVTVTCWLALPLWQVSDGCSEKQACGAVF